ncbi:MAG: NAD-dependent epimerase/dehydratase family protein [Bryobacteraceae bacterium]|nr:NAD-dependent epimerase/dehydratase family protein [Bryobacteraceae bacterium]
MILITGGTGFVGSHLVEAVLAHGAPPRCLVRRDSFKRHPYALPAGAEPVFGDLVSGEGLDEALSGVETVIHLAGVTKALSTTEYYSGNVRATENLARAVAGRGILLVHVSSQAAIGPSADGAPVSDDAEPHPLTHYGRSKLEGERIVRSLVPEAVIVRPGVVYGPRDTDVLEMFKSISRGFVLEISGGERWFQAIYVKDLAEGLLAASRAPQAGGRAYFLAHSKAVSWSELSSTAARIMRKRTRVLRVPAPLAYAVGGVAEIWSRLTGKPGIISCEKVREAQCRYWTCDTRRAARELGFEARTPLELGLAQTLAWYKEAGWLKY